MPQTCGAADFWGSFEAPAVEVAVTSEFPRGRPLKSATAEGKTKRGNAFELGVVEAVALNALGTNGHGRQTWHQFNYKTQFVSAGTYNGLILWESQPTVQKERKKLRHQNEHKVPSRVGSVSVSA